MGHQRNVERELSIIEARTAGETFLAIGAQHGISAKRVWDIWQRHVREMAAKEAVWRKDLAEINAELDAKAGE